MTRRKTAEPFIKRNEEYVKLQGERERPARQAPGKRGYDNPVYARWTVEELREAALELRIEGAERASRAELIERLEGRDAAVARRGGSEPG